MKSPARDETRRQGMSPRARREHRRIDARLQRQVKSTRTTGELKAPTARPRTRTSARWSTPASRAVFKEYAPAGSVRPRHPYRERCKDRVAVIQTMGFSGATSSSFLGIHKMGKQHGYSPGARRKAAGAGSARSPGRGSPTSIDRVQALVRAVPNRGARAMPGLLRRRISMKRAEEAVLKYVRTSTAKDQVGQGSRRPPSSRRAGGLIRDIARADGDPVSRGDKLAKL